jgi:DNA repair exonuclease SbcCD ATPase subunit
MFKMSKFLWLFLIGCSILIISGCGTGQKKNEDKNAGEPKSEIAAQLLKEHNDLITKANQEIHNINQKLIELNEKIKAYNAKGGKLTVAQNKEIDEIEKIRATINPRIHEINNVSREQWETFKTTFEKDLEDVKTRIDVLLNELK